MQRIVLSSDHARQQAKSLVQRRHMFESDFGGFNVTKVAQSFVAATEPGKKSKKIRLQSTSVGKKDIQATQKETSYQAVNSFL